ncbi:Multidrug-efflux transporter 1 regulator [uncultured Roseburia sp.]|uniref:MerR family transcriptional regulator n=1 Tax=Brotonthovivens ammoniilytica TaxID=2981725 RepID=A0ABT2TF16_9FIRM|nr:MerR family transcriptional regulator [Brotonthovivens ammoniilytica]MCU6760783.1 MerR family transcriptional regulator [Brotonthovivens ammoniilytica]SCI09118.1 Multidrug-efflux transporter 1 regulator [uncultured Roseburia sp.]
MKREDLLTITELAKLRKVTSEALRHYDRIGLIKPDYIDPRSGYRYYSIRQYEKLGTVKELRALGMSLSEVQDYFNNRNIKKSTEILSDYQKKLEQRLLETMALNKLMKRKLKFLRNLENLPPVNTLFEQIHEERYMITFGEPTGGPREHAFAFTKLEGYLNEIAPILASDRVGVYADERILEQNDSPIPAVPMIFVDNGNINSEYLQIIPAGKYLCLYYPEGRLEQYHPSFELIKSYLQEHNLEICGKILQIYKVDVTITSNRSETILEIQVPVQNK